MTGLSSGIDARDPAARIRTDLPDLLLGAADAFALGQPREWSVLTTGYEDCNAVLCTEQTKVVVKIFAADRTAGIAARTADLILRAQAAGVRHPRLHLNADRQPVHSYRAHQMLVMDFASGHTLYDLDRAPSHAELTEIIAQTVRLHTVDAAPPVVFDPWAITNLRPLAGQVRHVLDAEQRALVAGAINHVGGIERDTLPTVLNHGDLTKGNLLLADDGHVTVLDFAVANRLPRVQELAVIAANLTHGSADQVPARTETIADLYSRAAPTPLSPPERTALRAFTHAAAAMELLGALSEWHLAGNRSPETAYLIDLGLAGLRACGSIS